MKQVLQSSYQQALAVLTHFCNNPQHIALTEELVQNFSTCYQNGNKIMICGNGGSACDAMHFAEELTGRYRKNRAPLAALSLTDPAHITCVANDFGYDEVFARSVAAHGKPGDWLIALSTSGNSANVIKAATQAKQMKIGTVALLGKNGGKLKGECDFEFLVPAETSDRIQEIHMLILHIFVEGIERILFPQNY